MGDLFHVEYDTKEDFDNYILASEHLIHKGASCFSKVRNFISENRVPVDDYPWFMHRLPDLYEEGVTAEYLRSNASVATSVDLEANIAEIKGYVTCCKTLNDIIVNMDVELRKYAEKFLFESIYG